MLRLLARTVIAACCLTGCATGNSDAPTSGTPDATTTTAATTTTVSSTTSTTPTPTTTEPPISPVESTTAEPAADVWCDLGNGVTWSIGDPLSEFPSNGCALPPGVTQEQVMTAHGCYTDNPPMYCAGAATAASTADDPEPEATEPATPTWDQDTDTWIDKNGDGVMQGYERCGRACGDAPTSGDLQTEWACEQGSVNIDPALCERLGYTYGG